MQICIHLYVLWGHFQKFLEQVPTSILLTSNWKPFPLEMKIPKTESLHRLLGVVLVCQEEAMNKESYITCGSHSKPTPYVSLEDQAFCG